MKPDITVLALDPSSKGLGWACSDGRAGTWKPSDWHMAKAEETARHSTMCGRAMLWLADRITEYEPAVIVIESGGHFAIHRVSERIRGSLMGLAYIREVAVELVEPGKWQRWAKANTDWTKPKDRRDHPPDQDEKDARAILAWFQAVRLPTLEAA